MQYRQFKLKEIRPGIWRLDPFGKMRVGVHFIGNKKLFDQLGDDKSFDQAANVATLPGVVDPVLTMPDIHQGYGFPIGGVAAFRASDGVVSPGGVGYDINCGVRMLKTEIEGRSDILKTLVDDLYRHVPCGVGSKRSDLHLSQKDLNEILETGVAWAVRKGFGSNEDRKFMEERGCLELADPDKVSGRAKERGANQLGTLGSGNHFVEVQLVQQIFDKKVADVFGLFEKQIVVTVHTGSRGLGYQVCSDYLESSFKAAKRYKIELVDRELAAAPLTSKEGKDYLRAMAAAANFAFTNRQVISYWIRKIFEKHFGKKDMPLLYDVCHNIAKFEHLPVDGKKQKLCIHRKGATRAYPAGHELLPEKYREVGQPVLVPGDMGRYSFVLAGAKNSLKNSWGSACHGAGRELSRSKAKKLGRGRKIERELEERGILVRAAGRNTVLEEMPEAYKDVAEVVEATARANVAMPVAKLVPLAVVKG